MSRLLHRTAMRVAREIRGTFAKLRDNRSGVALVEFAYSMPILVALGMTGTELANYASTRMRISQIALAISDHSSRMGEDGVLQDIKIYESDINDVFIGAQLQSGALDLKTNGRVILTSLETNTLSNGTVQQKEGWKRCYGNDTAYTRQYTVQSDGMGVAGSRVTAAQGTAVMFVEVAYTYKPLFPLANGLNFPNPQKIVDVASFYVRDDRDLPGGIYAQGGVTPSTC